MCLWDIDQIESSTHAQGTNQSVVVIPQELSPIVDCEHVSRMCRAICAVVGYTVLRVSLLF